MVRKSEIRGAVLVAGGGSVSATRVELASADSGRLLAAASIAADGTFVLPDTVSSVRGVSMVRVSVYQGTRLLWRSLRGPEELQQHDLQIQLAARTGASVVRGEVRDARGRPVRGVLIKIDGLEEQGGDGGLRKVRLGETVTDAQGAYRLRLRRAGTLHPGTLLRIRASGPGGEGLGCAVHLLGDGALHQVDVALRADPQQGRPQRWLVAAATGLLMSFVSP